MKIKRYILCGFALCTAIWASAQSKPQPLTYQQYMEKVSSANLEYAAEKLNVSIAEAEAIAANVNKDPELAFEYTNNEITKTKMGKSGSVSISQSVTFGKRTAAVGLARSQSELSKALLADYFRNLRAEATIAYLEATKQEQLHKVKQNAYKNICELAKSDSIRHRLGKIMEIDAIQSRLESGITYNGLMQSEAELNNSFSALNLYIGNKEATTLLRPQSTIRLSKRAFDLSDLIKQAIINRADLTAALQNIEVANRALKVARRERNMDVDISLGVSHNAQVTNEDAPAPAFSGITAGITIPLQFSRINKGSILAAKRKVEQASLQYEQATLRVQNEVMQAYQQYQSMSKQVEHYENGMLNQANQVLTGKIYSYNRGEVSLLEVLNAQRTYDEVQATYYETLFNYASSLVQLEKSAGIWDIRI